MSELARCIACGNHNPWIDWALADYARLNAALEARGLTTWGDTVTAVVALLEGKSHEEAARLGLGGEDNNEQEAPR